MILATFSLPLVLEERNNLGRLNEPVTVGVPLPRGAVFEPTTLGLIDQNDQYIPLQTQPLACWSDGSIQWLLLDFQANVEANGSAVYKLKNEPRSVELSPSSLVIQRTTEHLVVDTGAALFFLNPRDGKPFDQVIVHGKNILEQNGGVFTLTDEEGNLYTSFIHDFTIEASGPVRACLKVQGNFCNTIGESVIEFIALLHFYTGSGLVKMQINLWNPRAAQHLGGLWDLGDAGSVFFKDFSLFLPFRFQDSHQVAWSVHPTQIYKELHTDRWEIYQDSSGGENWQSSNHVNCYGEVKHTFRGYRISSGERCLEEGLRATPVLAVHDREKSITATVDQFWQNFPKALEVQNNNLIVRLFPQQYDDLFELQGGEQKTHVLYLQFGGAEITPESLIWVHDRLVPRATPEWYASTKSCFYLSPRFEDSNAECQQLVDTAIAGPQSFFARREIIDEYGWRHFGDLYADHEAVKHSGSAPLVAHYNNQYDVVYGALVQYLRSGDRRWFELVHDLARHVIDIDIYHTREDRPSYNGGLFWHTDHYLDAATATHRAYSRVNQEKNALSSYGGGPSNEHNYTTGLLHYYFLTGDLTAKEAVLELADWVIGMDDGSRRPLGLLDKRPTGLCSSTADRNYHGPGRGAGNSINALLDAYVLTSDERYLTKAEQIIRRCIHPRDNIQMRNLEDVEHRWSYTVFLQVIGKYLELKAEKNALDFMYGYAQASLLHYAEWMLEHEVPYSQLLDRVEIPTETWPAQDIRKCCVFHLAAKHALEPLRSAFTQKAVFFFQACINDLRSWETYTLTRPLVLLMTNAYVHDYFQYHTEETAPQPMPPYDFGLPQRFTPQFAELYWAREKAQEIVRGLKSGVSNLLSLSSSRLAKGGM